ncbi:MAG TPA: gene transfer agent family protein [Paracoccus solventivorans]|uniref:Gene transfer agent family protein n=1 Tax=Paracoccus solventivorans TaxID=53463 RepID=A0A832PMM5_9RHOB|nr:gene transfer agent family protein [Paracoccus solventivorans]HHW34344.1 gene transfer agent family protein [Paracoccus solventivorans]
MSVSHLAFFGDAEYRFCLTDAVIPELERLTGSGIGTLFVRLVANQFHLGDLTSIIRLGLIGGGMDPQRAQELVSTYAVNVPFDQIFPLAVDVLTARWTGAEAEAQPEVAA